MPGAAESYDLLRTKDERSNSKSDTFHIAPRKIGYPEFQLEDFHTQVLNGDVTGNNEVTTLAGGKLSVDGSGNLNADGAGPADADYVTLSDDPDLSNETQHANITGGDLHDPATHSSTHAAGGSDEFLHALQHEDGGSDELDVTGLSGDLADAQDPKAHSSSHESGGSDVLDVGSIPVASTIDLDGNPITDSTGPVTFGTTIEIPKGESVQDNDANTRFLVDANFTSIADEGGSIRISANSTGTVSLSAEQNSPVKVRDSHGSFDALFYNPSSTKPGELELTNAELNLQGGNNPGSDGTFFQWADGPRMNISNPDNSKQPISLPAPKRSNTDPNKQSPSGYQIVLDESAEDVYIEVKASDGGSHTLNLGSYV